MTILDIIFPWSALSKASKQVQEHKALIDNLLEHRQLDADALRFAEKENALQIKNLLREIHRLEDIIANGHYRNPKTGRLGRKGERFDTGARAQ